MKFSHIADVHIGAWRDPKMHNLSTEAFIKAIDRSIEKKVDFILISGDLFNTSLPPIDKLNIVVKKLRELKNKEIPIYMVAGSHDFSPSGKTMLKVLENAGLLHYVVKGGVDEQGKLCLRFTKDEKTGAKITGMMGRKGMLERKYYETLHTGHLEKESGFKIFMFHTALTELKPKHLEKMASSPISFLPKGFDYYAGGHVHIIDSMSTDTHKNVVYPGPLFPVTFAEIEKLQYGGFYVYDNGNMLYEQIKIKPTLSLLFESEKKDAKQIEAEILEKLENKDVKNTIVTMRVVGSMHGRPSEIDFKKIFEILYEKDAYYVMKSTSLLKGDVFEEIKVDEKDNVDELEEKLIEEHLGQVKLGEFDKEKEKKFVKDIMQTLNTQKQEGERVLDFEERIKKEIEKILEIELNA
jgi:DNA repair protein SbcD/Mre11